MSNTNRDYAIIYDIKNSSLILSRPLVFYITDKNTSNIFVRLVTKTNIGDGVDQYTDIENASSYILIMRVIKPNDEVTNIKATQCKPESIFEFDLTEGFKDIPGTYICELMISTIVDSRQELITSDSFTYEVKRSILSRIDEIIEHKDTTVEKLLNELDATKSELSSQIEGKVDYKGLGYTIITKEGSTDKYNSDDIDSAINEAKAKGEKNVYLKNGVYEITRPIEVLNGFKIFGNSKTIIHDYTNDYAIKLHGGSGFMVSPIVYSQIENLEIINKSNSHGAISINNAYMCSFKNIKIINSGYVDGEIIKIVDFFNLNFSDIHILNANSSDGIVCDSINGNSGQLNFYNCLIQKVKNGMVLNGTKNLTDGVNIIGCGIGYGTESLIKLNKNITGVNITACHFEHQNGTDNGDVAIKMTSASNTIDSITILGNRFVNCKYGIYGGNSTRVFIQNNQFHGYNISNSVAIYQADTDVRWFIGTNQCVNYATQLSENGTKNFNIFDLQIDKAGNITLGGGAIGIYYGKGYPEGVIEARKGSIFLRTDGPQGTYIYTKCDDGGKNGWRAFAQQTICFSNSTRPSAASYPIGSMIYNTETKKINIANGEYWYDALGNKI